MSDEQKQQELESVPLKSDTDAPVTENEEGKTEETNVSEQPEKVVAPRRNWCFGGNKKKTTETKTEVTNEEEKTAEEKEPCQKKKPFWKREKKEKSEAEQKEDHISIGINLVDRDEKGINDSVKFNFEDVFGEPDTTHSFDCVWRLVHKIFTWTQVNVYKILVLFVGLPIAFVFGVLFALFTALHTFFCAPFAKLSTIPGNWVAKTWNWLIRSFFDPVFTSIGLVFGGINCRKYGINSQPTDVMLA